MFRLLSLWRNLTRRGRVDADLDDELRATVDALIEERRAAGASTDQARRAALIELGGIESVKQQVRDVRRGALLDTIGQDLRYGWRLLVRNPLFALTAALSLAVGIGATTSIFTVANGLLLRAAEGVVEPGRLVDLVLRVPGRGPGLELMSYPDLVEVRRRARTLDQTYGYQLQLSPVSFGFADGVTPGFANLVTANYFQALGVTAAAGRLLEASDGEAAGSNPVAVLSHHFWMRRFAGDPDVVGTVVRLNGVPMTIIGVAAAAFKGLSVVATDAWLPVSAVAVISPEGHGVELTSPRIPWLMGGGRLRPGSTRAQASAEVAAIGAALARERPLPPAIAPPASQGVVDVKRSEVVWSAETATPIPYGVRTLAATFLTVLMAVVSVVLIIACANLAGVLLARATTRRREIAVRTAVGAARGRLVRQLLIETGLLFFIGGVAGIGLARLLTTLLVSLLPVFPLPVSLSVPLDARVLLFTLVLSLVAAVLSGLAPALHASRADVVTALKDDAQGPLDRLRLRNAFVAVQVAFSILLVVVAGLIVRAFDHTLSRAQGFDPRGVDIASVDLVMAGYTAVSGPEAASRVLARIRQTAGFESASLADRAPGGGARVLGAISVPGVQAPDGRDAFMPNWTVIGPGYFETLRVPVLAGREFTAADAPNAERVAIVSQATARRLWPGRDPLGQYVQVRVNLIPPPPPAQMRIVGVVGDLTADSSAMALYVPLEQRYISQLTFLARRSERDPGSAATLRTAIESAEPGLPVLTADALERAANPVQVQLRIAAVVAGSVGVVGLLLAAIGIYGVTAYAVTQRTREIGIRLSLGARQGEVIALVLRQGMTVILIGSVIGLGLGVAAGRALSRQQYGIPGTDVPTLAAAALLFTVVGLAACYVPVRRAARIRATEALRYE